ncbi:MAG: hypothetical protein ACRDXB_09650, partial [Actinomycetes bacterium]
FYYAIAPVLTLGLVFNVPMLEMWGKFPDVRLLDAARRLPPELAWRAVVGLVGARLDIPGAWGYLAAMAIVNPDQAMMIGETTIAKEAVQRLLGHQAAHTLNPAWVEQVQRLVTAAVLVSRALADKDNPLTTDMVPAGLRALLADPITDPDQVAADLVRTLIQNVDALRVLVFQARHPLAANDLLDSAALAKLPVYNPHLHELLQASSDIGYLTVLHNDFGLARILGDARYTEAVPDEQHGMPLLALLREYPKANVVIAHLGVGKWTTLSVEHLRLIGDILRDPAYAHVNFDISWNEVARHLQATEEITDAFIDLVAEFPDRFIFGSDAVKPESAAQYFRHHHDLERIFVLIRERVGEDALAGVRYANLERLLATARERTDQWKFNELSSRLWDDYLDQLTAPRRQIVTDW